MIDPAVRFIPEYPIAQLVPADYNPRQITPGAFELLQDSIRQFGVVKPIILNSDDTIIAGHQRTKAMQAVGLQTTPAVKLPLKVRRAEEIQFNQMHNRIETVGSPARIVGDLHLGYQSVAPGQITGQKGDGMAEFLKETMRLLGRYGPWGSVICSEDGTVIANSEYALACQTLRIPLLIYVAADGEVPGILRALGVDYGEYNYEKIEIPVHAQHQAQLNRLRGARDEDGNLKPHTTDMRSVIYQELARPHLETLLPEKARVLDFGAGHGDEARNLRGEGWPILDYEPFRRVSGKEAWDVRGIVRMIRKLGRDVEQNGLFPVVILDSVLNSVVSLEWEDLLLTAINALVDADGVLFTNTRSLENLVRKQTRTNRSIGWTRSVSYLDTDNFEAAYHKGRWRMQHYHSKPDTHTLLSRYFEDVADGRSGNYHYVVCRGPRNLGMDRYEKAVAAELNMELTGGFHHNQHEDATRAILNAVGKRIEGASK